jgi:tricorn protease
MTGAPVLIEGGGVEPDIAVENDPAYMQNGADPRLDRAIAEVLKSLQTAPPHPPMPTYPNRSGVYRPAFHP